MNKLETVADFEKARRILLDASTLLEQYCVEAWGYCSHCKGLTKYTDNDVSERRYLQCLECTSTFNFNLWPNVDRGYHSSDMHGHYYLTGYKVPKQFQAQLRQLHSRVAQDSVFKGALEQYISELKRKQRDISKDIRRLAKLRSNFDSKEDAREWAKNHIS